MTSPMYPVKYTGPDVQCANFVVRPRRPLTSDYRQPENAKLYRLSTVWQVGKNPSTGAEGELWMLSKIVANIATWIMLSGGGGAGTVVSVTGDDGVATFPDGAGDIDLVGNVVGNATHAKPLFVQTGGAFTEQWDIQLASTVVATPLNPNSAGIASYNNAHFTVDPTSGMVSLAAAVAGDLHVARYIVSAGGAIDGANFTTIASAYAAATLAGGAQTVFVQPGIYTENITLADNVNLCAFIGDQDTPNVTIIGKLTATFAGTCSISGIRLQTNGDYILEVTGANATNVNFNLCYLNATNASAILNSSSGGGLIDLFRCEGDLGTIGINYFTLTVGNSIRIHYCFMKNSGNSTTQSTLGSGVDLSMFHTLFFSPIASSGSASMGIQHSDVGSGATALTINGTGQNFVTQGSMGGPGAVAAITIGAGAGLTLTFCNIAGQTPNVITGAGTLSRGLLVFTGSGSTITTAVQNALVTI